MLLGNKTDLNKFRSIPFWAWNDKLDIDKLVQQVEWMHENAMGGFFMHARSGLVTEYMSDEWMKAIDACVKRARELGMEPWAYDENGWPSGFAGGKLLEDIENHDKYLTCTIGEYDESALVSYLDTGDKLIRSNGGETGTYINVYEHYATSTADILNPDVTDKFIKLTHEEYKSRYGEDFSKNLKGFFTDEPQYYRWDTTYTDMIVKYFTEVYGEDIYDGLGLLFLNREGYREFRYKFWYGLHNLMLNNYSKKVYEWCDNNGVQLTGHYVEETSLAYQMMCCGGVMPFYEYEHIPGIDWLGRYCDANLSSRQVLSAAKQLGKEKILCEMYAATGWDITPRELKNLTENMYLNGINITCQHFIPYSERASRAFDYPAHFSPDNPWIKYNFKEYNEYFNTLGALLSESEEQVRVAVLHPMHTAYLYYTKYQGAPDITRVDEINEKFMATLKKLADKNISYHFIDEVLLSKHGSAQGNTIVCGKCKYDFLVIPSGLETMDEFTEKLVSQYVKSGGKVLIDGEKPKFITWKPFDYEYLNTNTDWDDIENALGYSVRYNGGELISSVRNKGEETVIFAVNHSREEECVASFDFGGKYTSFKKSYVGSDKISVVSTTFTLRPNESVMLVPSNEPVDKIEEYEIIVPSKEYTVLSSDPNNLLLDFAEYSTDGVNYSDKKFMSLIFQQLLEERYKGDLYLKYSFKVDYVPSNINFKLSMLNIKDIFVNDTKIAYTESDNFLSENIASLLKKGDNNIVIKLNYWQRDHVYYVLFGENITEGLINCLVYDSEIEPIVLIGDFAVYSEKEFIEGDQKNIKLGESFYIGKKQDKISGLVENGYPFFGGKITLKQTFNAKSQKVKLHIPFRWHIARVFVNGKDMGLMMFDDMLDVSSAVNIGENELQVEFVISGRNLLGPHHSLEEPEPDFCSPEFFDIRSEDKFRENYSLVEAFI